MMKHITILGATGFVGKRLTYKAIKRGYQVKVLVRNTLKLGELIKQVEVIEGNYFDCKNLSRSIQGSCAVLSTVGPPMNENLSKTEEEKYISSLKYLIEEMENLYVMRWINISGAGVKLENETIPLTRKLLRVMFKMASQSAITIKDKELQLLAHSHLDWTSLRPPMIKNGVKGNLEVDENKFLGMEVDVDQLIDFMLDEIEGKNWIKKAVVLGTKN